MDPTQSVSPDQIPSKEELYDPILKVLSRTSVISTNQLMDGIIEDEELHLTPAIKNIKQKDRVNKPELKNRIEWACSDLKGLRFIRYPKDGYREITDQGREALENELDIKLLLKKSKAKDEPSGPGGSPESFFDYLSTEGLEYDTENVEDFLLSLKAKQFVILSGGTGTGKTRLAKAYGEFISSGSALPEMKFDVKFDKSMEDGGMAISRKDLMKYCPDAYKADLQCKFRICGLEGEGELKMDARFFFNNDEHNKEIVNRLVKIVEEGTERADLYLTISGKSPDGVRYRIVPVGSNWTDNRHILGYRNAISGGYARTPSLDLLIASSEDPSNRYMLILDEMNLSHVERYLSDIISCMESGEPVRLDSDGSVPESILVGDNLFIVGTVNMDETTYTFSPKVLDRANVLEFEPSFENYLSGPAPYEPAGNVAYLQDPSEGTECRRMNARDVIEEMRRGGAGAAADSIIEDLGEIWKMMSDMGLPFAYRTLDEVMRFIYVAWKYEYGGEFPSWRHYLDAQIRQKILPKIHGNVSILEDLKKLSGFCGENRYDKSKDKLDRMASALRSNRYVTFNCRP